MTEANAALRGVDFARGVPLAPVEDGAIQLGHGRGEAVLLVRHGDLVQAVGAICTHYGAPLVDGLLVGDAVRCPWHHACFSLRNGEVLRARALTPIACWKVEQRDGVVYVREKLEHLSPEVPAVPESVVIVGSGGAGNAAAVTLSNRERLAADQVVIGVGVRPNVALAQQAGLAINGAGGGVSVDEHLETSSLGIYAAGDITAWPDPLSSDRIRVEHGVIAERQGPTAARNMLGARVRLTHARRARLQGTP